MTMHTLISRLIEWGRDRLNNLARGTVAGEDVYRLERGFRMIARGEPLEESLLRDIAKELRAVALESGKLNSIELKSVSKAPQAALENSCACRPLLKQAVEIREDAYKSARGEYERRRLTHIDFLPAYARGLCEQACRRACQQLEIKAPSDFPEPQQAQREIKRFIHENFLSAISDERGRYKPGPLQYSGFAGSFSYSSALFLIDVLDPAQRRDSFSFESSGTAFLITDRFSPASDGPLGKAAVAAWREMAKIALACVILEDLLSGLPFEISPDIRGGAISRVINSEKSPWAIVDSRLVRNALELNELYEAGQIDHDDLSSVIKIPRAMFSPNLEQAIGDIQFLRTSKKRKATVAQAGGVVREAVTSTQSDKVIRIGNPKWEFYAAIHSARPDELFDASFRRQHAALYRIYRTTDISLQDCVDLVRKGGDAEARFVSGIREQQLQIPPRTEHVESIAQQDGSIPEGSDLALESSLEEPYQITGEHELKQSEWFLSLDQTYQRLVSKRFERLRCGNFGDWRRLEGVQACELRFHRGSGQRVYFIFTGPNSIHLLCAGSKHDQDSILARLRQDGRR